MSMPRHQWSRSTYLLILMYISALLKFYCNAIRIKINCTYFFKCIKPARDNNKQKRTAVESPSCPSPGLWLRHSTVAAAVGTPPPPHSTPRPDCTFSSVQVKFSIWGNVSEILRFHLREAETKIWFSRTSLFAGVGACVLFTIGAFCYCYYL